MPDVSTLLARGRARSSSDTRRSRVGPLSAVAFGAAVLLLSFYWGPGVESDAPLANLRAVDPASLTGLGDWYTRSDVLLETTGSDVLRGWPTDPWTAVDDGRLFDPLLGEPETRSEISGRFQA